MSDLLLTIPREVPLKWFGGRTFSQVWADERREALERQRERRQVIPPASRLISFSACWVCIPSIVEPATEYQPERRYAAYCSVPPGYRCHCGNGWQDHDPGDEG